MPTRESRLGLIEAAILAAAGFDQNSIRVELGITQGAVSKRIAKAIEAGYLRKRPIEYELDHSAVASEDFTEAEFRVHRGKLLREVSDALQLQSEVASIQRITLVRAPSRARSADAWTQCLRAVADAGARRFDELLEDGHKVGVAWGYTGRYWVDAVIRLKRRMGVRSATVFPVAGSFPLLDSHYPLEMTSTAVARDLAEFLNGRPSTMQINLDVVPAFLPTEFADHREVFMKFFRTLSPMRAVFGGDLGGPEGLLAQADILVTGMGDMPTRDAEGSPSLKTRLRLEGVDLNRLAKVAVGDLGGTLLPRRDLSHADQDYLHGINSRFLGPSAEHYLACSRRAVENAKPGVIAITHGAPKAAAVVQAVRMGLINELILDDMLAEAVVSLCRGLVPANRKPSPLAVRW